MQARRVPQNNSGFTDQDGTPVREGGENYISSELIITTPLLDEREGGGMGAFVIVIPFSALCSALYL